MRSIEALYSRIAGLLKARDFSFVDYDAGLDGVADSDPISAQQPHVRAGVQLRRNEQYATLIIA